MQSDLAIEVEDLQKHFGSTHALRGLSFSAKRGSVLGVLGPNGAGKTTAVRCLSTLIRPDAGRALVDGINVVENPKEVRRRIGLTGQAAAVDEYLTAIENLEMFGRLFGLSTKQARARGNELLEQFGLTDAAKRISKNFSGGMRRRLDLAAGLICKPSILFLDEPTTGLDPRSRNQMWEVIRSLVAEGTTLLLTTQYLEEADLLADDIVVIDHGVVIARGTADSLKREVGGERLEVVVIDESQLDQAVSILGHAGVGEPNVDRHTRTVSVAFLNVPGRLAAVANQLEDAEVRFVDFGLRRPTLDEVFLQLTGRSSEDEEVVLPNGSGSNRKHQAEGARS